LLSFAKGQFTDAIHLCEGFLTHRHDLIHKATGWMLREIGKRDELVLKEFLDEHVLAMPRTMLRYAIEKLPPAERKAYLLAK
jgi:3-methyladenine DNA glycosylase AlkD